MRLSSGVLGTLLLSAASPWAPAVAQSVGMKIVDTAGAPVGVVTGINGDNIQVKTDKHEVQLAKSSFTLDKGKLLFGMTQAQLNAKIEEAAAAAQASVVAGATVNGMAGTKIGKIETVADGQVTISLDSGKRIQVPASGVRGNADGTVTIGLTAEQIEAQVNGDKSAGAGD